jgi:DNA-binding transcriptional LysR family regulator
MMMSNDLWPGLDLRHLAAFSAVAETHSFARAADELGYTQPAVSNQIAALEKIIGQRLFERSSGRSEAQLTEAGTVLRRHVEAVTARLSVAKQDLRDLDAGEAGHLRVGAFQSALAGLLPRIIQQFGPSYPAVDVEVVETTTDHALLDEVRLGRIDFAFALLPLSTEEYEYRELVRDGFVLVSKVGGPGPHRLDSLADLAGVPLITFRTCRSAAAVVSLLETHTEGAQIVFRSDDNAAIKEMVRAGLGAAILPELWIELGDNEGLELTSLEGLVPPRVVVLAWRAGRQLTVAQQAFVDITTRAAIPRRRRVERLAS